MLLVDNCTAHPHLDNLKNICLDFFTCEHYVPHTANGPGNYKEPQDIYRKELVYTTLDAIEDSVFSASSTAMEISSKVTILDAIRFLAKSWRQVKAKTIINCFAKGGFRRPVAEPEDAPLAPDEELDVRASDVVALPEVINGAEYIGIDHNAPCFVEETGLEDAVVDDIVHQRVQSPSRTKLTVAITMI